MELNPLTALTNAGQANKSPNAKPMEGVDFGALVKRAAENTLNTFDEGEEQAAKAVTGNANIQEVVTAVTSAELTLELVVAVRNKVVDALQQVTTMPI